MFLLSDRSGMVTGSVIDWSQLWDHIGDQIAFGGLG